ncbi:hypothetical protein ASE63_13920 [Bosea sp. Root381]|uniref:hypothetical protein n=1 Tax=Bosea sp. Root381 TaxID=1736524 RepID=UPI0006F8E13A|nr:hypothetical protein [Bosea sp. Root381]KRE16825.1 hypothetical protein ASE63_13920 [Bosea sp. Root381]
MTNHLAAGLAIALNLVLAACQSTPQAVQQKEDLLSAAGFTPQPANTPQRIAAMKKLPPNKFVQQTKNSQIVYVYADPVVCQCVYFGVRRPTLSIAKWSFSSDWPMSGK